MNTGNVFTAQLSDANESFTNPVNIGTLAGTNSGSINATIPSNTAFGNNYLIRVIASNPNYIGFLVSQSITIQPSPVISKIITEFTKLCDGMTTDLTANGVSGDNVMVTWWTGPGGTGTNLGTGLTLMNVGPGTYYARGTGTYPPAAEVSVTIESW